MDPKRLLDGAASPLTLHLLEAGAAEAPRPEVVERALHSTLLAAGIGLTLKSAPAAALASNAAPVGAAATNAGGAATGTGPLAAAPVGTAAAGTVAALPPATVVSTSAAAASIPGAGAPLAAGLATSAAGAGASTLQAGLTLATVAKWVGVGALGVATAASAPQLVQWVEQARAPQVPRVAAGHGAPATPAPRAHTAPPSAAAPPLELGLAQPARPSRQPESDRTAPAPATPRAPLLRTPRAADGVRPDRSARPGAAPLSRTTRAGDGAPSSGAARATALPSSAASTLRAEVASIELARSLLDGGNPGAALREVARHERDFASPQLRTEALVLRMEALSRSGQHERARALAGELLADGAAPPHAARARAILGEQGVDAVKEPPSIQ